MEAFLLMAFYVYIIQSEKDNSFYKGFSTDCLKRLEYHNLGKSKYTATKMPWKLVYIEELPDKKTALIREKNLKKAERSRIEALIACEKNILNNQNN